MSEVIKPIILDETGQDIVEAVNEIKAAIQQKAGIIDDTTPSTNKVFSSQKVTNELDEKVDKEAGKTLSENDFTDSLKDKLDGIEEQANKTVVDATLSDTSTNPVQNKVVKGAIDQVNQAKVNIDQGLTHAGKVLGIGADGMVTPVTGGSGGVTDVQANGTSIVDANGVANIPMASSTPGLVKLSSSYGIDLSAGWLATIETSDYNITNRTNARQVLTARKVNNIVIAALTDTNHIVLDATQQATAQSVLGILSIEGVSY